MRLAIVGSRGYPSTYGGFETLVRQLAPYLVEHGHDVSVYSREPGSRVFQTRSEWIDGVECVMTPGIDRKTISTLSFGATAAMHAARRRVDAAIVLNPANGFFLPIMERAGVPTIVNVDGLEWKRDKWNSLGKRVFLTAAGMVAKHASVVVVDSKAIGEVWQQDFGVETTFIPYGGDVIDVRTSALIEQVGLTPDSYLLYVARLVPENNVDLFIEAATVLRDRHPIVVVGTSGYGGDIDDRMARLAEHPNVTWLGHVHDQNLLTELWVNAGVYFHGHSVGGTNPSLLQALGAGAPTVAFDSVFNREVLGTAGVVVGDDVGAVVESIGRLMVDLAERKRLRELGQRRISADYTWGAVCESYLTAAKAAQAQLQERAILVEPTDARAQTPVP